MTGVFGEGEDQPPSVSARECIKTLPSLRSQDPILTRVAHDGSPFPRFQSKANGDADFGSSPIALKASIRLETAKQHPQTHVEIQAKAEKQKTLKLLRVLEIGRASCRER